MDEMTLGTKVLFTGNDNTLSASQKFKLDIPMSVDYYWELIDLSLDKTSKGFFVVPTKLGKAITGRAERDDITRTTDVVPR